MITLTLMTEWQDWPLRIAEEGEVSDSYSVEEISETIPLSPNLLSNITAWDESFQATYRPNDPKRSGFYGEKWDQFIATGRQLAHQIKQETGEAIIVEYAGDGSIPTEVIPMT